ncbi:HAD family hydrolase [Allopontixanthobacter sp.]|uniref:HAD family hydrolase n=1 Tax=Allopontixanthobacter sp. TaxID=2906452 RepID=UPI002ABB7132|nr:HAD family hydrolase [Allopontixanthobacter sp.]MDZ4307485.1 hypothetical protein [Allopontixanthobacter sp.]
MEQDSPKPAYSTYVFDCDGVVLNSNELKTLSFREAALPYGEDIADALAEYHVKHRSGTRFEKFRYLLEELVPPGTKGPDYDQLLELFADAVWSRLLACDVEPGLADLRKRTAGARWLIVSGGAEAELRKLFPLRGIAEYFDGGIFGSPHDKGAILAREIANGNIAGPALFIGDSACDYDAASAAGLDFAFATWWSGETGWPAYVASRGIPAVSGLSQIT